MGGWQNKLTDGRERVRGREGDYCTANRMMMSKVSEGRDVSVEKVWVWVVVVVFFGGAANLW